MNKKTLLFLCTGNSCRSQMAEGFGKKYLGSNWDIYSAGIEKHGINPHAATVMKEEGIDLYTHQSNTVDELPVKHFDYVITVCGHADANCPYFSEATQVIHYGFDDPPGLTKALPDGEEKLAVYRRVRDEIKLFVMDFEKFIKGLA